jgi:putative flippase GtrA
MDPQPTETTAPAGSAIAPSRRGRRPSESPAARRAAVSPAAPSPALRLWRVPLARQLTRFTGVGIVCTLSSLALFALCRPWLGAQAANAVALILTSVMNTGLNRRFTFRVRGAERLAKDHLNGLVAMAVALALTSGSLAVLHWVDPSAGVVAELWTTTVAGWAATAVRFALLRLWIFRRARDA